jgi:hypothetical protein
MRRTLSIAAAAAVALIGLACGVGETASDAPSANDPANDPATAPAKKQPAGFSDGQHDVGKKAGQILIRLALYRIGDTEPFDESVLLSPDVALKVADRLITAAQQAKAAKR